MAVDGLQLAAHLHVAVTGERTTYLLTETTAIMLQGRIYARLVPLLDGSRTRRDLVLELADEFSALAVGYALERLADRGTLSQSDPAIPRQQVAYWSAHGIPAPMRDDVGQRWISVVCAAGVEGLDDQRQQLLGALAVLHVPMEPASWSLKAALTVVVAADYLHPELAEHNKTALASRRPWMLVRPGGPTSWIGPMFIPGETGCWECLVQRLRFNLRAHAYLYSRGRTDVMSFQSAIALPTTIAATTSIVAGNIAGWLRSGSSTLAGSLLTLDLQDLSARSHTLVRRPQCAACGHPEAASPSTVMLTRRRKSFTTDGGHRSQSPDTTLGRFGHHVSPLTGVVSELRRYDTGSDLVTVYAGLVNGGQSAYNAAELRNRHTSGSAGKGVTDAQARASALCEALERISGDFTGEENRIRASYAELGAQAINPAVLLQVSHDQYRTRAEWNRSHSSFAWIPEPFDPARQIDWTPAISLNDGSLRYLPTAFCFYGVPMEAGHHFCSADSNGNAAGGNAEEAVLQGFLELVERDSVAIWWYNRLRRPPVDLRIVEEDDYLVALRDEYQSRGRKFWVIDVTTDLGIPSCVAISRLREGPAERIIQGYGAHLDARIALLRAVTEMNQMLALTSAPPPSQPADDPDNRRWLEEATVRSEPYLVPNPDLPPTSFHGRRDWSTTDLRVDIERCIRIARNLGMDTLVVNQTRPDLGIDVVKVVVPGLRHFWARFAPGRLYEVPVKMGWRSRPLAESELNPRPISS